MVYLAAPPHGAHGLKFIVLTLPTRHGEKMFQRSAVRMNPADIIKDAVALIKEWNAVKKNTDMMLNPGN